MDILPKGSPAKDLTIEQINGLGVPFLAGYIFGHDHPKRFLEMLEDRFRGANRIGPNTFFIVGMLLIYGAIIEEGDRCFLLNTDGRDDIRLAYDDGILPQRLVSIYQNIGSRLVKEYESSVSPLK
jgi:hypothetical protein